MVVGVEQHEDGRTNERVVMTNKRRVGCLAVPGIRGPGASAYP